VIATWYALADLFEADPLSMFAWRGRGREDLFDRVRTPPSAIPGPAAALARASRDFWAAGPRAPRPPRPVGSRRPDAVLDQLDRLELTLGRHDVTDLIRPAYEYVADSRRGSAPPDRRRGSAAEPSARRDAE
jgi:hypothetical protein